MKDFIDIQNVVTESTELKRSNTDGFVPGDWIQVTEKVDGANASVEYVGGKLECYSRKHHLNYSNTLQGFWNYVQKFDAKKWEPYEDIVVFGEWLVKHSVRYANDKYGHWYVYDAYNKRLEEWLQQKEVKELCEALNLEYVHEIYLGEFKSWDHIRDLAKTESAYGAAQMEGVVVKNLDKLCDEENRLPVYLKYVNEGFKETKAPKEVDVEKENARAAAAALMATVCTEERVRKEIYKCRDEGLLELPLEPTKMSEVAKLLPSRIYQDILKEEPETLKACGEFGGRLVSSMTMQHARKLILG